MEDSLPEDLMKCLTLFSPAPKRLCDFWKTVVSQLSAQIHRNFANFFYKIWFIFSILYILHSKRIAIGKKKVSLSILVSAGEDLPSTRMRLFTSSTRFGSYLHSTHAKVFAWYLRGKTPASFFHDIYEEIQLQGFFRDM